MTIATAIKAFQVGKTYSCRSVCDYECVWTYTIKSRTAATIKTECGLTLRINKKMTSYFGVEMVQPRGNHSMAPILRAE